MRESSGHAANEAAKQARAARKVHEQEEVVQRLIGSAFEHPEQQQLLNEMRFNKASLDFNQAMLDFGNQPNEPDAK